MEVQTQYNEEIVNSLHNAFRMLFKLARDCSASGMFAVNNVMSCPVLSCPGQETGIYFLPESKSLSELGLCLGWWGLPYCCSLPVVA